MKKFLLLSIALLGLLTACAGEGSTDKSLASPAPEDTTTSSETAPAIPTLFIHGYSGGKGSFGGMINRLSQAGYGEKSLVVTVAVDGTLTTSGDFDLKQKNPLVQVLFADNQNNEWNQSQWIKNVVDYLGTLGVSQVNLVGHSMGGVSSFRYLTGKAADTAGPTIHKFVAIAAPFNGFPEMAEVNYQQSLSDLLANGPTEATDRFQDFTDQMAGFPQNLPTLLIAGQLSPEDDSDGVVPVNSALAVNQLLTANQDPVTTEVITEKAQHSQLHENSQVDQLVARFLWEE